MSLVQHKAAQFDGGSSSPAVTLTSPTTAGNTLIAYVGGISNSTTVSSVTMPTGWVAVEGYQSISGNFVYGSLWIYPSNPGGISTITATTPGGGNTVGIISVAELTDQFTSTTDGTTTNNGTSGAQSVSFTPSGNGDLCMAAFASFSSAQGTYSTPSGWTLIDGAVLGGYNGGFAFFYQIQATGAPLTPTPTYSQTSSFWLGVGGAVTAPAPADSFPVGYDLETQESNPELALLRI